MRYTYNLHGWITRIETECLKEYLSYAGGSSKPCFNGNISTVSWRDACSSTSRGYRFFYDSLNRMIRASYGEGESLAMSPGRYDETAEYDRNGNITKLERHGMKQDGSFGIIDNLKVSLMGNRIATITDDAEKIIRQGAMDFKAASDGRATYTYNAFGALTSDTGRGITMIQYDNFHNPIRIQFANGSVTRYVYSADGAKLRTVHYTAMPNITVAAGTVHELTAAETQAVDSVDYLLGGNLLLRNGRIDKYLFEGGYCEAYKPVTCIAKPFIPTFDGFIEPSKENRERFDDLLKAWEKAKEANFNMDNFNYYFYNTDHLGNIREVVDAMGHVVQATSYYPFGTPISDPHSAINSDLQPFKYNGKELDMMHGLNTYDYGARQYEPILGRWDRMDPMCEKYYSVSPYAYCGNNPVNRIDLDGREDWPMC